MVITAIFSLMANASDLSFFEGIAKLKYFLLGILSIPALIDTTKNYLNVRRIRLLLNAFFVSTTIANISGIIALFTGYHFLRMKASCNLAQACGMYGMTITYGYNVELLALLFLSFYVYRKNLNHLYNDKIFYVALAAAMLGLYFSYSRGGMIGFIVAFPLVFLAKSESLLKKFYGLSAVLLIAIIVAMGFGVKTKVFSRYTMAFENESNRERISQYMAALYAFK